MVDSDGPEGMKQSPDCTKPSSYGSLPMSRAPRAVMWAEITPTCHYCDPHAEPHPGDNGLLRVCGAINFTLVKDLMLKDLAMDSAVSAPWQGLAHARQQGSRQQGSLSARFLHGRTSRRRNGAEIWC